MSEHGKRIQKKRKDLGLSVRQLASEVGVSHPYLYELEAGTRNGPLSTMERIGNVLGMSLSDIDPMVTVGMPYTQARALGLIGEAE